MLCCCLGYVVWNAYSLTSELVKNVTMFFFYRYGTTASNSAVVVLSVGVFECDDVVGCKALQNFWSGKKDSWHYFSKFCFRFAVLSAQGACLHWSCSFLHSSSSTRYFFGLVDDYHPLACTSATSAVRYRSSMYVLLVPLDWSVAHVLYCYLQRTENLRNGLVSDT